MLRVPFDLDALVSRNPFANIINAEKGFAQHRRSMQDAAQLPPLQDPIAHITASASPFAQVLKHVHHQTGE